MAGTGGKEGDLGVQYGGSNQVKGSLDEKFKHIPKGWMDQDEMLPKAFVTARKMAR